MLSKDRRAQSSTKGATNATHVSINAVPKVESSTKANSFRTPPSCGHYHHCQTSLWHSSGWWFSSPRMLICGPDCFSVALLVWEGSFLSLPLRGEYCSHVRRGQDEGNSVLSTQVRGSPRYPRVDFCWGILWKRLRVSAKFRAFSFERSVCMCVVSASSLAAMF